MTEEENSEVLPVFFTEQLKLCYKVFKYISAVNDHSYLFVIRYIKSDFTHILYPSFLHSIHTTTFNVGIIASRPTSISITRVENSPLTKFAMI